MATDTTRFGLSGAFARMVASFQRRDVTAEAGEPEPDEATQDEEWVDDDWDEGRRRARIITVSLLVALASGALISVWLGSSPRTIVQPKEAPDVRSSAVPAESTAPARDGAPVDPSPPRGGSTDSLAKESSDVGATRTPTAGEGLSEPRGLPGQPETPAAASPVPPRALDATGRSPETRRPAADVPRPAPVVSSTLKGEPSRETASSRDADRLDGGDIIDWLVKEAPHRR
jgi:hypothetical protein